MAFCVQYDELGNISATVETETSPICARQLVFDSRVETDGKRVNLDTLQLEDIPQPLSDGGQP